MTWRKRFRRRLAKWLGKLFPSRKDGEGLFG